MQWGKWTLKKNAADVIHGASWEHMFWVWYQKVQCRMKRPWDTSRQNMTSPCLSTIQLQPFYNRKKKKNVGSVSRPETVKTEGNSKRLYTGMDTQVQGRTLISTRCDNHAECGKHMAATKQCCIERERVRVIKWTNSKTLTILHGRLDHQFPSP